MRKITRTQQEILQTIINETLSHGAPTSGRVSELQNRDCRIALQALVAKGYVAQHYERGPYVPIRDTEGRSMRMVLETITEKEETT